MDWKCLVCAKSYEYHDKAEILNCYDIRLRDILERVDDLEKKVEQLDDLEERVDDLEGNVVDLDTGGN